VLRPLPLPAAARGRWCEGGKPARLARHPWVTDAPQFRGRARRDYRAEPTTRARVCAVREAEDRGDFDEAAGIWKKLGDPDQELRCRVSALERAGKVDVAAGLLEASRRWLAAARRWRDTGNERAAIRCEARHWQAKGRHQEAARLLASLGESVPAAAPAPARQSGKDAARPAASPSGAWPSPSRAPRPRATLARASASPEAGATAPAASGDGGAISAGAVLEIVTRYPGVTCEEIGFLTRMVPSAVSPVLARLVAEGHLVKHGRTRGTRYFPSPDAAPRSPAT
jgi:hypothetical protein